MHFKCHLCVKLTNEIKTKEKLSKISLYFNANGRYSFSTAAGTGAKCSSLWCCLLFLRFCKKLFWVCSDDNEHWFLHLPETHSLYRLIDVSLGQCAVTVNWKVFKYSALIFNNFMNIVRIWIYYHILFTGHLRPTNPQSIIRPKNSSRIINHQNSPKNYLFII